MAPKDITVVPSVGCHPALPGSSLCPKPPCQPSWLLLSGFPKDGRRYPSMLGRGKARTKALGQACVGS